MLIKVEGEFSVKWGTKTTIHTYKGEREKERESEGEKEREREGA